VFARKLNRSLGRRLRVSGRRCNQHGRSFANWQQKRALFPFRYAGWGEDFSQVPIPARQKTGGNIGKIGAESLADVFWARRRQRSKMAIGSLKIGIKIANRRADQLRIATQTALSAALVNIG
jgi:hypothetical protein